jgi:hypothetical protein
MKYSGQGIDVRWCSSKPLQLVSCLKARAKVTGNSASTNESLLDIPAQRPCDLNAT